MIKSCNSLVSSKDDTRLTSRPSAAEPFNFCLLVAGLEVADWGVEVWSFPWPPYRFPAPECEAPSVCPRELHVSALTCCRRHLGLHSGAAPQKSLAVCAAEYSLSSCGMASWCVPPPKHPFVTVKQGLWSLLHSLKARGREELSQQAQIIYSENLIEK